MNEERVKQSYRDEGWGVLAEEDGLNPLDVESSARMAYQYCYDKIEELRKENEKLAECLQHIAEGVEADAAIQAKETLKKVGRLNNDS